MENEEIETGKPAEPPKANRNAAHMFFKGVPITWRVVGGGVIGVLLLAAVARWLPDMKERMKFFTESALGWLVFVVVAVQAYIYLRQAQIMERSLAITTRAYVGVHSIEAEWEAERIAITIENTGQVPAEDVKATVELRTMIPKGWLQPNEEELTVKRVENDFGHTKLFSGNLNIKLYAHLNRIPKKYHPLFVQGHAIIIIRCWITYGDGFGNTETTEFAFNYFRDADTKEDEGHWYTFPVKTAEEWARPVTVTTYPPEVAIQPKPLDVAKPQDETQTMRNDDRPNPN